VNKKTKLNNIIESYRNQMKNPRFHFAKNNRSPHLQFPVTACPAKVKVAAVRWVLEMIPATHPSVETEGEQWVRTRGLFWWRRWFRRARMMTEWTRLSVTAPVVVSEGTKWTGLASRTWALALVAHCDGEGEEMRAEEWENGEGRRRERSRPVVPVRAEEMRWEWRRENSGDGE